MSIVINMASREQLRKLRQKYHLGEYSRKSHVTHVAKRRVVKRTKGSMYMPRRHARRAVRYIRSARRSGRRSGGLFGGGMLRNAAVGVGAATLVNFGVSRFAPQFSNLAGIGGLLAAWKLGGMVGAGAAILTTGALDISGILGGVTGGTTASSNGATF